MRRLALSVFLLALLFGSLTHAQTGFCMSSPGNGPSTINSGETVWGGYSFTYPTVHEAAKLEVRSGTLTLIVDCEGNPKTITVNLPDASYSTPREEKVANPLVWYPTSSESGQTAFQGSGTAPTCPSPMQVVSARLCLSVTSDNNVDTVWFRWHYDTTTGSESPSYKWSDAKAIVPPPICDGKVTLDNPECGVACQCTSFEAVLIVENPDGTTTISFEVTNACQTAVSYIAIGTDGLVVVAPSKGTYISVDGNGDSYSVDYTGDGGRNPGFPSIKFTSANQDFKLGSSDIFTITVRGYYPGYTFSLQTHIGGQYTTYTGVDLSNCICPQGGCPYVPPCPPGYARNPDQTCSETECADIAPDGQKWVCVPTGNPKDPWRLTTIPEGGQIPDGGFELGDNIDQTDSSGYKLTCDCKRRIFPCANRCCGMGTCDDRIGVCTCQVQGASGADCCTYTPPSTTGGTGGSGATTGTNGPSTGGSTATTGSNPPPLPCYNNGNFCNGRGICTGTTCDCNYVGADGVTYTGDFCDVAVVPPNCYDYSSDCTGCLNAPAELNCAWCGDVGGDYCGSDCPVEDQKLSCDATVIPYVPGECQSDEDCSSKGSCVESEEGNYCVCDDGERGVDCGSGGLSNLGKALAISGGIIALIVIGGVAALVLLGFGVKKGVDFIALREMNMAASNENPLYIGQTQEHRNPLADN